MQILLANAKIMRSPDSEEIGKNANWQTSTKPMFQSVANKLAEEMAQMDVEELAKQLDCNKAIATENRKRYQDFNYTEPIPAIIAYNGQAYKHLKANTLSKEALSFGQKHLWITCFLYGLLRPLDAIVPYRMEHCVTLEATHDKPVNQFWKDKLTDVLIESVKADDGILVHLSTEEYEHLFDWKRIKEEVKVIQPLFYIQKPNGDLNIQAVWAKSCRGAMTRHILQNQITSAEGLYDFAYEGFEYKPNIGEATYPHFIRE